MDRATSTGTMLVVIDTCVYIDAFEAKLAGEENETVWQLLGRLSLEYIKQEGAYLCISDYIKNELQYVLCKRDYLKNDITSFITTIDTMAWSHVQHSRLYSNACADKADLPIIGTVMAAKHAQNSYIVTRDSHLLAMRQYQGIQMVHPAKFLGVLDDPRLLARLLIANSHVRHQLRTKSTRIKEQPSADLITAG